MTRRDKREPRGGGLIGPTPRGGIAIGLSVAFGGPSRRHTGRAYLTGAAHIAAGLGVLLGIYPRLAAAMEAVGGSRGKLARA